MINQKIYINTLGSCCTRDIFRICDKEEIFVKKQNVGFISPMSLSKIKVENSFEIENIVANSVPDNFSKRNTRLDLNKEVFSYLAEEKADYLIMDLADIRFPIFKKNAMKISLRLDFDYRQLQKYLLSNGYKKIYIDEFSKEEIDVSLDYLCDELSKIYPPDRIIVLETFPIRTIIDGNNGIIEDDFHDRNFIEQGKQGVMRYATKYVATKLGCHLIRMPDKQYVVTNRNHTWGRHCLHYSDSCYKYFFERICSIVNPKYEDLSNEFIKVIKEEYMMALANRNIETFTTLSDAQLNCCVTDSLELYLSQIKKLRNCVCVFSIKDTAGFWLDDNIQRKLWDLGLIEDLRKQFMVGYIAVLKDAVVIHESKSECNGIEHYEATIDTWRFEIESKPFLSGNLASIRIDGTEFCANSRGINIVVFDTIRGVVIDSVAFDTHVQVHTCSRKEIHRTDIDVLRVDIRRLQNKIESQINPEDVCQAESKYSLDRKNQMSKINDVEQQEQRLVNSICKSNVQEVNVLDFPKVEKRKETLYNKLTQKPIVIFGGGETAKRFCSKYHDKINIKVVLTNYPHEREIVLDNGKRLKVLPYSKNQISVEDYIIVCRGDINNIYKDAKQVLSADGLHYAKDYILSALAETILERKKIMTIMGYCHLMAIEQIFRRTQTIPQEYGIMMYSFLADVHESSYKYEDTIETVKLSDVFIYVSHFAQIHAADINYVDLIAEDTKTFRYPNLAFRGLHPYRAKDLRVFNTYLSPIMRRTAHPPRPFQYAEQVFDELIEADKSTQEICDIVLDENFISEKEILRNFKIACKSIEINEQQSDLKMLDYIMENYKKKPLYKDCLHYEKCMYYEVARRIATTLDLCDIEEINAVEEVYDIEWLDITQTPVLPCVAKTLGIEYATDDYLYKLRIGDDKTYIHRNREEWIRLYCDCMKAVKLLQDNKIL